MFLLAVAAALGGEIAVEGLPDDIDVRIEGLPASHGHEGRGLPAGTHTVYVLRSQGERPLWRPVMVGAEERVVLGPGLEERSRGPIPERSTHDPSTDPQWLHVALAERHTTRVYVDNEPVPFVLDTGTWDVELPPGEHELLVTVGGRRRHRQTLQVNGAAWRCGVDGFGTTTCVQLVDLSEAPPIDLPSLLTRLDQAAPADRLDLLADLDGVMSCEEVARVMGRFVGDQDRLAVARALRPHVANPGAWDVLARQLSFSSSRDALTALYQTR